jgi:serine/threonine protein kinase
MKERPGLRVLFLWTAGCDRGSVQVRRDAVRYSGIGAAVWLTTAVSSVAAYVALRLAFSTSVLVALGGALVWALFIFNTDRMLVAGRTEWVDDEGAVHNGVPARLGVWTFRLGLSLLLALTITDPLIVELFSSEIRQQLPRDNAAAAAEAQAARTNAPQDTPRRQHINDLLNEWHADQQRSQDAVSAAAVASKAAQCEKAGQVDCGPGVPPGTGRPGTGTEYRDKQQKAAQAQQAAEAAQRDEDQAHQAYVTANDDLVADIAARPAGTPPATGYFAHRQALENYVAENPGVRWARWILVTLLVAVDMSAVLLKGLFRDGQHDDHELAKIREMTRARRAARNESQALFDRGQLRLETELAKARDAAVGERETARQVGEGSRAAALAVELADIELARDVKLARIAKDRARRLADIAAEPPPAPPDDERVEETLDEPGTDADADATLGEEAEDATPGPRWGLYNQRWQVVEPLHYPAKPQSPWIVTDLRGEYPDELVLKPLSPDPTLEGEEAQALARQAANQLSLKKGFIHRNVADILEAGTDPHNGSYLVHFKYDTDLHSFLISHTKDSAAPRPFLVRDALDFSVQLAEGMVAVWTKMQRIHLDIKPGNVGLEYGTTPTLKLLDFGLTARIDGLSPSGNDSHNPRGTPFYAAPEQWEEARKEDPSIERLSIAADLRGLGATIFRMFVGQAPGYYEANARKYLDAKGSPISDPKNMFALYEMLVNETPKPLDTYVDHLPGSFVALVAQFLCVDPTKRNPGPSVDDPEAYGRQVLDSLRYNTNAILAQPAVADRPVADLRKSAWGMPGSGPGPAEDAGGRGPDDSTVK